MPPLPLPTVQNPTPGKGIDYELFLDCVHCGLCTAACPTYVELGTEMDSPRGRIYLMRGIVDGRIPLDNDVQKHLDLCLNCRACETACPSGVQYGRLLEPFRVDMVSQKITKETLPWWQRFVLFSIFPYANRAKLALAPAKLLQKLRLDKLLRPILPRRMKLMQDILPRFQKNPPALPEWLPAEGKKRATVALVTGCVNDALFYHVNYATANVLQKNGCDVWIPKAQVCCGALHHHAGQEGPAIEFAKKNCEVFLSKEVDAIVMNVAGCSSTLKDYGHLLALSDVADAGMKFQKKTKDINEFLMELGPIAPTMPMKLRATYHDACHLAHAQQIRKAPRDLLKLIPGLELLPLPESEICCGAAGSYNLTQPEMAERLGQRKKQHVLSTKPDAVFTANAGCLLQIAKYLRNDNPNIWVAHPIEALWASYNDGKFTRYLG